MARDGAAEFKQRADYRTKVGVGERMSVNVENWHWTLANIFRREDGVLEFLLRWRVVPRGIDRGQWPSTLVITWENRFSTPEGFPVERELEAMGVFELRLGEAVEKDALAVMSISVTGQKERVLVFHTHDVAEFSKRLHEMPQEEQRYPIYIEKFDDPSWTHLDETFARFGLDPSPRPSPWESVKSLVRRAFSG